jgi:hypothetical protein
MLATLVLVLLAQTPAAAPSPLPVPAATASPVPVIGVAPEFTAYHFWTSGAARPQTDLSNGLLNFIFHVGKLHADATLGTYAFPTVGFPLVPNNEPGTNVALFSPLPVAVITYNITSHLSFAAGKFAALLGQESPFSYENLNVQRGLVWNMEPTISRGVQLEYTNGPLSITLQDNDAYYSGRNRAFEGLLGWSPSSNTSLQVAAIVPGANVPPNATVSVGNKAEYDLMYSRTIDKLQLLPYLLWVHSPKSPVLGYTSAEDAQAAVLMCAWTFSPEWSFAYRYEDAWNYSSTSDSSANADLVGFGPGSSAESQTLTAAYRFNNGGIIRLEYSHVSAAGRSQSRYGMELGVMH